MKWTGKKWIFWWAAAGLLVPTVLLLNWLVLGHGFGTTEVVLWPSSMITMALESQPNVATIVVVYAIAIATNIMLYSMVGAVMWLFIAQFRRE
jgi:hypothetical protein